MLIWHRLGLGAPLPEEIPDGDWRRQNLTSNDKLRKQLLGKDFPKLQARKLEKNRMGSTTSQMVGKTRPALVKRHMEDDVDDEGEAGRTSLGKAKRQSAGVQASRGEDDSDLAIRPPGHGKADPAYHNGRRKPVSNYLDEVLAEKSQRKKHKKRKKEKAELEFI